MGESITEGTVASWLKNVGDAVAADEAIAEIETDKVTQEIFSPAAGVLKAIHKNAGDTVEIHEVIGSIEVGAEAAGGNSATSETPAPQPEAAPASAQANQDMGPAARKMVAENNVNPADVQGSGRHGQVTKQDVIAHLEKVLQPHRRLLPRRKLLRNQPLQSGRLILANVKKLFQ